MYVQSKLVFCKTMLYYVILYYNYAHFQVLNLQQQVFYQFLFKHLTLHTRVQLDQNKLATAKRSTVRKEWENLFSMVFGLSES